MMLKTYGFDLLQHLPSPNDRNFFERIIVCINKYRSFVASLQEGINPKEIGRLLNAFIEKESCKTVEEENDFFVPFLQDDVMLMCVDDVEDLMNNTNNSSDTDVQEDERAFPETVESLKIKIKELEGQLSRAKGYIASLADERVEKNDKQPARPDNDTYYFHLILIVPFMRLC